jgi:hypothetical protein
MLIHHPMHPSPARALFLSLILAACGSDICEGTASQSPCPGGACPQTWKTDRETWCPAPAGDGQGFEGWPIRFITDCHGFDVANYVGVDTGFNVLYRESDGHFVGVQAYSANFGGSQTCVAEVPDSFTVNDCGEMWPTIVCAMP